MTGAPVPPGADAVVMVEHVQRTTNPDSITLVPGRTLRPGENIVPPGAEARAGAVIIPAGTRLTPAHIAAAAQCGAATVDTYARPRVAILATGDELVEVDGTPLPHQIRNSNSYSLAAQVRAAGGEPQRLPIAHDDREHLARSLDRALTGADLLLLSGGVSMGQYDLVEEALAALGAEFFFTGVLIQPGKPAVYGRVQSSRRASPYTCFFGLPGNPVSTLVTFLLFAAPLIRALAGETETAPRFVSGSLMQDFQTRPGLTRFLPAQLESSWDKTCITPVPWQGSGDLASTARANCFLVVPPDATVLPAGTAVQVLLPS